jgi:hypothetical protein
VQIAAPHRTEVDEADAAASDIDGCVRRSSEANFATAESMATNRTTVVHENPQPKVGVTPLGFLRCPLLFDT